MYGCFTVMASYAPYRITPHCTLIVTARSSKLPYSLRSYPEVRSTGALNSNDLYKAYDVTGMV